MTRILSSLAAALGAAAAFCLPVTAQTSAWANVRTISTSMDVQDVSAGGLVNAVWKQAETVEWRHRSTLGGQSFPLTASNSYVQLEIQRPDDTSITYLVTTAEVTSASAGQFEINLSPTQSNLQTNEYRGYIKLMQTNGASVVNLGVLAVASIVVEYSPDSSSYDYIGDTINDLRSNSVVRLILDSPTGTGALSRAESPSGVVYTVQFPDNLGSIASTYMPLSHTNGLVSTGTFASTIAAYVPLSHTNGLVSTGTFASTIAAYVPLSHTNGLVSTGTFASTIAAYVPLSHTNGLVSTGTFASTIAAYVPLSHTNGLVTTGTFASTIAAYVPLSHTNGLVSTGTFASTIAAYVPLSHTNGLVSTGTFASTIAAYVPLSHTNGLVSTGTFASTIAAYATTGAVHSKVAGGYYGPMTNDLLLGRGDTAYGAGLYSEELGFISYNGTVDKTNSLLGLSIGGVDQLWWRGSESGLLPLMSNGNFSAHRMTNGLDGVYQRIGVGSSATDAVSSIAYTSARKGGLRFHGDGITQLDTNFYWNNYLLSSNAETTYLSKNGGAITGAVTMGDKAISNVFSIETKAIDLIASTKETVSNYMDSAYIIWANTDDNAYPYYRKSARGMEPFWGSWNLTHGITNMVSFTGAYATADSTTNYANRVTFNSWTTQQGVVNSLVSTGLPTLVGFQAKMNQYPVTNLYLMGVISNNLNLGGNGYPFGPGFGITNAFFYHIWPGDFPYTYNEIPSGSVFRVDSKLAYKTDNSWGYVTLFHSGNFTPSSYRTITAEGLFNTNLIKVLSGAPTGVTQVVDTDTSFSFRVPTNRPATNIYFGASGIGGNGTNWARLPLEFIISTDTP